MRSKRSICRTLLTLLFISIVFSSSSQNIQPLEPVSGYYKNYSVLSSKSNPARAWMDTIMFPWSEYSQNAITNSLIRTFYLSKEDEAKLPALIDLPANSSNETRAELDYLLQLQKTRTKEQIARALYIANIGSWFNILNPTDPDYNENKKQLFYIAENVGSWYNYQNFPATTQLLFNCIQDTRATEFRLKWNFKRPRPYHLEPNLQPLTRIKSPSFASGHTLWAFTQAFLFSEIMPEKRAEFIARADEIRWSRELLGIHYPSDNEASRVISWNLLKLWMNNPEFVQDLNKAKQEWSDKKLFFN